MQALYWQDDLTITVYVVRMEKGPWGTQYFLRSVNSLAAESTKNGTVYILSLKDELLPVAATISTETPYSGMEVRIQ